METVPPPAPARASQRVKVGGGGLLSSNVQQALVTPEEFLARADDLLGKGRGASARRWIERYPDVALEVLRSASSSQARSRTMQVIARVFDEQCCRAPEDAGWPALLRQRAGHPERFTAYDQVRARLLGASANQPIEAEEVKIPVVGKAAEIHLGIEGGLLAGKALLRANRPADAVAPLKWAWNAGRSGHPYEAIGVSQTLGEALLRAGQKEEAVAVWKEAVEMAATLLAPPHPVADPVLWEQIAASRPVTVRWPALVARQLDGGSEGSQPAPKKAEVDTVVYASSVPGVTWADEDVVWAAIGRWRLGRGEPQAALLAFKRAEAATPDDPGKERLRLFQAKALVQTGQSAAAIEILARLAAAPLPAISRPALATLGVVKFRDGQVEQSLSLLCKAIEDDPNRTWPGRSQAEADLGLAYLANGDEARGVQWLHTAQRHFEAEKERGLLLLCLDNEAAYRDRMGNKAEAAALRRRQQQLESE
jgi:tetratricopeptide (TPR) repeat protein